MPCPYARIFEPAAQGTGPSGFADPPRAFVFRAAHLDGRRVEAGEHFSFDFHVFDADEPELALFVRTFAELATNGLGPGQRRSQLDSVWQIGTDQRPSILLWRSGESRTTATPEPMRITLDSELSPIPAVTIRFLTPTELKSGGRLIDRPDFAALFGRARDRVSTLRALYGAGPLPIDFRECAERVGKVRLIRSELRFETIERRSSRTGQVHPLGGFVGTADYEGDLAEFLPILRAATWTGIGRQTVWGKGHIDVIPTGM